MKWLRRAIVAILGLLIAAVSIFVLWAMNPLPPMPEALAALTSTPLVQVEMQRWLVFTPRAAPPATGFVFYPGGRVDPRSYAPAAQALAEHGILVVITPMPLNLAVFGADRAAEVIAAYPHITRWAVGGHSLGGTAAASFARRHAGQVSGLVLWAAYPADADDVSALPLVVASIYGALDGVSPPERITSAQPLLPTSALWVAIDGGNHAQFGWYGVQERDNPATISRVEQQQRAVEATLQVLRALPH